MVGGGLLFSSDCNFEIPISNCSLCVHVQGTFVSLLFEKKEKEGNKPVFWTLLKEQLKTGISKLQSEEKSTPLPTTGWNLFGFDIRLWNV